MRRPLKHSCRGPFFRLNMLVSEALFFSACFELYVHGSSYWRMTPYLAIPFDRMTFSNLSWQMSNLVDARINWAWVSLIGFDTHRFFGWPYYIGTAAGLYWVCVLWRQLIFKCKLEEEGARLHKKRCIRPFLCDGAIVVALLCVVVSAHTALFCHLKGKRHL